MSYIPTLEALSRFIDNMAMYSAMLISDAHMVVVMKQLTGLWNECLLAWSM